MRKSFIGTRKRQFMKYDILFSMLFVIQQLRIFSFFFFLNYEFDEISYVTCRNVAQVLKFMHAHYAPDII